MSLFWNSIFRQSSYSEMKLKKKKFVELEFHSKNSSSTWIFSRNSNCRNSSSMNSNSLNGTRIPQFFIFFYFFFFSFIFYNSIVQKSSFIFKTWFLENRVSKQRHISKQFQTWSILLKNLWKIGIFAILAQHSRTIHKGSRWERQDWLQCNWNILVVQIAHTEILWRMRALRVVW